MVIENHKEEVPFAHYEALFRDIGPEKTAERLGVRWNGKEFYVNLLGRDFAISHPVYALRALDGQAIPSLPTQTFLLRYLLEGKKISWSGTWKTFREMPWGEMYIKPYTGRVLTRAAFTFGTKVAAFRAACEKMGAVPASHGDAGYQFCRDCHPFRKKRPDPFLFRHSFNHLPILFSLGKIFCIGST